MKIDYLIIGQGISGSFLAFEMQKAGLSYVIIDDPALPSASQISSGIINPVTGRRIVETWMIEDLLRTARIAYREMEELLAIDCFRETSVLDFFPTPQMRLAFTDRLKEGSDYLSLPNDENDWRQYLQYDLGYGIIRPAYLVDMFTLLAAFRNLIRGKGLLKEEFFDAKGLVVTAEGIQYNDILATKLIFCDGTESSGSTFFKNLPFAPNKGEALIADIPGLPADFILKKGINIVPWKNGLFWIGSSHEWNFETEGPTEVFRERTIGQLSSFCRLPFSVVDHLAGVRPATLERRPFVGFHPKFPQVGIFNGMGTKGCSLAPYFARHWVDALTNGSQLMPEADVKRFERVLSRG